MAAALASIPHKFDQSLSVPVHHDVYPAIDPATAFAEKKYAGKTVLVTGASRGIGQATALFFAKAGANVALVARSSLDATVALIEKEAPDAKVAAFAADVTDAGRAEDVVGAVVERFGGLDVLVANAATGNPPGKLMGEQDPKLWWATFEVNVFGVYAYVRPALKHLAKASGHVVIVSSSAAISRVSTMSDYQMSKHVLIRMAEMIALEYPSVKAVAFHPGAIDTALTSRSGLPAAAFHETRELAAAGILQLVSGRFDWLSPRYIDGTWDFGEVEKLKDVIVKKDVLICKLALS